MMKTLIEYDYKPVEYVTFIIYYQSFKKVTSLNLFYYFAVVYCDCACTIIRIRFSVYGTSVV